MMRAANGKTQPKEDDSKSKHSVADPNAEADAALRGMGPFSRLPMWIISRCLSHLKVKDLCSLAITSKQWSFVLDDDEIWKKIAKLQWKGDLHFRGTWKRSVLDRHRKKQHGRDYTANHAVPRRVPGTARWYKDRSKEWDMSHTELSQFEMPPGAQTIDRRHNLTLEEFVNEYDIPQKPVVISGAITDWPANTLWSKKNLKRTLGDKVLRAGTGFKMTVKHYLQYMNNQCEGSPLYLFDGKLNVRAPDMLTHYNIPTYFKEDYYQYLSDEDRPPYRWVLMGPARTGPAFHVDPYLTPAWNAVVWGRKRWAMYPPGVQPPGAGDPDSEYYEAPRPIKWYKKYYERLGSAQRPVECMHGTGELMFLPAGWWHQVINTEDTLAVTQNYVNRHCLKMVYDDTKKDKSFNKTFRSQILDSHPELWDIVKGKR